MTHFRVRWVRKGGLVHARVLSARTAKVTHGKNGDLSFTEREWTAFIRCFRSYGPTEVAITPEDEKP